MKTALINSVISFNSKIIINLFFFLLSFKIKFKIPDKPAAKNLGFFITSCIQLLGMFYSFASIFFFTLTSTFTRKKMQRMLIQEPVKPVRKINYFFVRYSKHTCVINRALFIILASLLAICIAAPLHQ